MTKAELKEALDMYFEDDDVVVCADENKDGQSNGDMQLIDYRDAWPWLPIESAPHDGTEIIVWCEGVQDLPPLVCRCAWHSDAGFCVDELREPKYWIAPPNAVGKLHED